MGVFSHVAQGDVRVLSPAKADAVIAMEQLPEKIALFLHGKVIEHEQAIYEVRRASAGYLGRDVHNEIAFHLDVTPLFPIKNAANTTSAPESVIEGRPGFM